MHDRCGHNRKAISTDDLAELSCLRPAICLARTLDRYRREANNTALIELLTAASSQGLSRSGEPADMARLSPEQMWNISSGLLNVCPGPPTEV